MCFVPRRYDLIIFLEGVDRNHICYQSFFQADHFGNPRGIKLSVSFSCFPIMTFWLPFWLLGAAVADIVVHTSKTATGMVRMASVMPKHASLWILLCFAFIIRTNSTCPPSHVFTGSNEDSGYLRHPFEISISIKSDIRKVIPWLLNFLLKKRGPSEIVLTSISQIYNGTFLSIYPRFPTQFSDQVKCDEIWSLQLHPICNWLYAKHILGQSFTSRSFTTMNHTRSECTLPCENPLKKSYIGSSSASVVPI